MVYVLDLFHDILKVLQLFVAHQLFDLVGEVLKVVDLRRVVEGFRALLNAVQVTPLVLEQNSIFGTCPSKIHDNTFQHLRG